MDYSLYLSYKTRLDLKADEGYDYECLREDIFADIIFQCFEDAEGFEAEKEYYVGFMNLLYYNLSMAINNNMDIMAAFSQMNHREMGEVLMDYDSASIKEEIVEEIDNSLNSNILIIQGFGIYPEYRGKGIGEAALNGLQKLFDGRCGYIFLKSLPMQHEESGYFGEALNFKERLQLELMEQDYEKAQVKLNSFYEKCGFNQLEKYPNFYYRNLDMQRQ